MRFLRWILLALLAVILLWIALLIVSALLVDPKKSHLIDSPYYRWLLNTSTRVMTAVLRIRVHVIGAALVPKDQRFLLVCNHRSNFDPILTWYALRDQQLAFISKPENFHIPVFGRIILRCGFLAIDRENAKNALVTVNEAARRLKSGAMSIAVYPEGTRSKTCELLPFHNGVFKISQRADAPILVCVIHGTEQIHRRTPWRTTDVYLTFVECIDAKTAGSLRTSELGERIRRDILRNLPGT